MLKNFARTASLAEHNENNTETMHKLTHIEIQQLIDKLEQRARELELESVAKRYAQHKERQAEAIAAAQAAVITRIQIQELSSLLH